MPTVTINIPKSLKNALDEEVARAGGDESAYITAALAGKNPIRRSDLWKFWRSSLVKTNYNCLGELKPFVSCRSSRELFNQSRFIWIRHALVNQFVPDSREL